MNKFKIIHYVLCWNEMEILPFVVEYWKRYATKVVVYDNGSTDGSVEFLKQYDWIEVRSFDTNGKKDNDTQALIKNTCWKESREEYDFVIVSDLDECLYFANNCSVLDDMMQGGYDILGTPWYALCEDYKPKYEEGKLLHEQCSKFYKEKSNHVKRYEHLGKFILFNPKFINDMNWSVGSHIANPAPSFKLFEANESQCFVIHINSGFGVDYKYARNKLQGAKLSEKNKKRGYSKQYLYDKNRVEMEYKQNQEISININDMKKGTE